STSPMMFARVPPRTGARLPTPTPSLHVLGVKSDSTVRSSRHSSLVHEAAPRWLPLLPEVSRRPRADASGFGLPNHRCRNLASHIEEPLSQGCKSGNTLARTSARQPSSAVHGWVAHE